jgi:signal peptidase I
MTDDVTAATIADAGAGKRPSRTRTILLWVRDIAIALVIALLIMHFIKPTIVNGYSMENTLHEKDYLLVNKQANEVSDLKHGDIIVFRSDLKTADNDDMNLIKRVIGTPGDRVSIKDEEVYVNDEKQDDSYTKDGYTAGDMEEVTVPEGTVFVLGDNRQNSEDSRYAEVGFVTEDRFIGKAFFRLFPIKDFGGIK